MNLPKRLEELVHDISSIRAGKTFAPSHYIEPVLTAIEQDILELIGEDEYDNFASETKRVKGSVRDELRQELRTKLHQYIRGDE